MFVKYADSDYNILKIIRKQIKECYLLCKCENFNLNPFFGFSSEFITNCYCGKAYMLYSLIQYGHKPNCKGLEAFNKVKKYNDFIKIEHKKGCKYANPHLKGM